jgi:5,5'-dehydrodivanillate O-demethylase oxygenase subunit
MLTKEMNERLTRVGPGTPLGTLLRRYWFPIARTPELDAEPVLAVTLLVGHAVYGRRWSSGRILLPRKSACPPHNASRCAV